MFLEEVDRFGFNADIVQYVKREGEGFKVYRRNGLDTKETGLPFLVSDRPFPLPSNVDVFNWGELLAKYMRTINELIHQFSETDKWGRILNEHVPEWMQERSKQEKEQHLFIRPDWILTEDGVLTAEIETSPFGLALSCFLEKAYSNCDFSCAGDYRKVLDLLQKSGVQRFVVTPHTDRFVGQFEYLAHELAERGHNVSVSSLNGVNGDEEHIYRCFYLFEGASDGEVKRALMTSKVTPPVTPQFEEKAVLGMLFEPSLESAFKTHFDEGSLAELRRIVPETVPVSSSSSPTVLSPSLRDWKDVPGLPRNSRNFVLKPSGFCAGGSWARQVYFLCDLSRARCAQVLQEALEDKNNLWVMQTFRPGTSFYQPYFDEEKDDMRIMQGRVRVTPYFDLKDGGLLTVKATLRPNTHRLHAASDSINTAVTLR